MAIDTAALLKQIEPIETMYKELGGMGGTGGTPSQANTFLTLCMSCITRITGDGSIYFAQAQQAQKGIHPLRPSYTGAVQGVYGIVKAMKQDIANGYLTSLRERIHADLFSDFLEAAEYLLTDGFKDPAAVMIGGVLEEHLRQLCNKNGIDIEEPDTRDPLKMKPKRADKLNSELANANVYGKLEQKQITAWLDIRNNAAHAHYDKYDAENVTRFLQNLRDFILKYPA